MINVSSAKKEIHAVMIKFFPFILRKFSIVFGWNVFDCDVYYTRSVYRVTFALHINSHRMKVSPIGFAKEAFQFDMDC